MELEAYQSLLQEIQGCQLLYVEDFAQRASPRTPSSTSTRSGAQAHGSDDPLAQLHRKRLPRASWWTPSRRCPSATSCC